MDSNSQINNKIVSWLKWLFSAKVLGIIISLIALTVAIQQISISKGGKLATVWDSKNYDLNNTALLIYTSPIDFSSIQNKEVFINTEKLLPYYKNETDITTNNVNIRYKINESNILKYYYNNQYEINKDQVSFTNHNKYLYAFSEMLPCITGITVISNDWKIEGNVDVVYDGTKHPINYKFLLKPSPENLSLIKEDITSLHSNRVYINAPNLDGIKYFSSPKIKKMVREKTDERTLQKILLEDNHGPVAVSLILLFCVIILLVSIFCFMVAIFLFQEKESIIKSIILVLVGVPQASFSIMCLLEIFGIGYWGVINILCNMF